MRHWPKRNAMNHKKRNFALVAAGIIFIIAIVEFFILYNAAQTPEKGDFYEKDGHWTEGLGAADPDSATRFAEKLLDLQANFMTESNHVFCAIVPDKGYYLYQNDGKKAPTDYSVLFEAVQTGLQGSNIQLIDLTKSLTLSDYYTTDSHWRQEKLQPVVTVLGNALGFSVQLADFEPQSGGSFVGAYGKGGATEAEPLIYLTNAATNAATVDNFQAPAVTTVYDTSRLSGEVPYDVFLGGATPLITIESPNATTDRELVIFRDSYASSLTPLLLSQYKTITMIDIRYMASALIPQYVTFQNQDVLFLYSTFIVNQSVMLR